MEIDNLKNYLHNLILDIGDQIYDERITKGQIGLINDSILKFSEKKHYENNRRIQFKLDNIKNRYNCEIEYLKYWYTEVYYKRKMCLEKLFRDGLPLMAMFVVQKFDYELQLECKRLINRLRNEMERDFQILLHCILKQRTDELTKSIIEQVEELFQKDLNQVYRIWAYCMNNIETFLNSSTCQNIVAAIHILCCEKSAAKLNRWQLEKENHEKMKVIEKYIKQIRHWKPQLEVCPNIKIWRKHFLTILQKYQKYFNFYHTSHEVFTFEETAENGTNSSDYPQEHKLDATPSLIYAAFDGTGQYCCNDESKVFVTTKTDVIPIKEICSDQMKRLRKEELDNLKMVPSQDKFEIDWNLCQVYDDDNPSSDYLLNFDENPKLRNEDFEVPNLLTDLLLLIEPSKLATHILNELCLYTAFTNDQIEDLKPRISDLLKIEIQSKLNSEKVLNDLNAVLGPAYEAVRMKRISALSYIRDSLTFLKQKSPDPELSSSLSQEKQPIISSNTYPFSLQITHQEYLDSFVKLPPYLFPREPNPPFDSIYKSARESEFIDVILSRPSDNYNIENGRIFVLGEPPTTVQFRTKRRRTSILKFNPKERLVRYYKMSIGAAINKLRDNEYEIERVEVAESDDANKIMSN